MSTKEFAPPTHKHAYSMTWQNIKFGVGDREILKGITGCARPGRALAIMGSSGAGKTTFLKAISDQLSTAGDAKGEGEVFIDGVLYSAGFSKLIGFVTQDDILPATATPVEAFLFSVLTRCGVSRAEADVRVDAMIRDMRLEGARDTVVGVPGLVAGLSGGERKRCNIGNELISDPAVLMLDEPTSGLDSVTANAIVATLQELSSKGRTVIYTIHQPTAKCLSFFDDLMLMCQGHVVYHGDMKWAVPYFTSVGFPCPTTHTPSDFFMTLLQDESVAPQLIEAWRAIIEANTSSTVGAGEDDAEKRKFRPYLIPEFPDRDTVQKNEERLVELASQGGSIAVQVQQLFSRSFKNVMRNKMYLGVLVIQNIFFGILAGLIFINLGNDVTGLQDRAGYLFMIAANGAFSSVMGAVNTFPSERAVFKREQRAGAYSPGIYLLAKSFSEFPMQIFGQLLGAIILYFLGGLALKADAFFIFFAILVAMQQSGAGLGMAISATFDNYQVAAGVAPMILVPTLITGGLLASTDRLRPYFYWLEKISLPRFGFVLMFHNEMRNIPTLTCDVAKYGAQLCSQQPKTGTQAIASYKLDGVEDEPWVLWIQLGLMFVLTRVLGTLALYRAARTKS